MFKPIVVISMVDGSFQLVALNSYELGTRCRTGAVHRISLIAGSGR
jgi:hypothetical protein